MRIKLDENLPVRLVGALVALGHDLDTVPREALAGQDDDLVWQAAQKAERFFITQDMDFSDIRQFAPGTHHGILLVRLRQPGRDAILQRVESVFQREEVAKWSGCFVVLTENKIRILTRK